MAEKNGYFHDEELDYELVSSRTPSAETAPTIETADRSVPQVMRGAFEGLEAGRATDVSMTCHWAVNMASSADHGRMWAHAYMLTFAGIMVPPESTIRRPADLRGVEIGVGYHSGSHFSCLQYPQPFIPPKEVKLSFIGGPSGRTASCWTARYPAANMWGTAKDILEHLGFRKIVDTTYMQGFLITGDVNTEDLKNYFRALQRAQVEIDAHSEKNKEFFLKLVPEKLRDQMDVHAFSNGRRIVFDEYTREVYESTHKWMEDIEIFPEEQLGHKAYEEAVLV